MIVDGRATWLDIILPDADGAGGLLRTVVTFRRVPGEIELEARTGWGGWRIAARNLSGEYPDVVAGLARATVRLPDRPDLELTWPPGLPPGVPVAAVVSDVPRLIDDQAARRAVRALYGFLPSLSGRPPGLTDVKGDGALCPAIDAMRRDGARITRATLSARASVTEPALRGYLKVTGRTLAQLIASCDPEKSAR